MNTKRLFVVTVASEKGGVGKTTIATNLAVFLKALREELPVTIASFDNHFSVDSMFAIGRHYGRSVAGLFEEGPLEELLQLGEFGVQFMASERRLVPGDDDPRRLRRILAASGLEGILVLDTRPLLDYFTRSALFAADLVLVPVKDRASLVNVASVRQELADLGNDPERLWVVPSLIDKRLRLREDLGMREFLAGAAAERGYQVVDTWIAKSPKVEGLATNLTSRVHPILTHARYTSVHYQFRSLAEFVLEQWEQPRPEVRAQTGEPLAAQDSLSALRRSRRLPHCPACARAVAGGDGYFFQDLRTRRQGRLHSSCLRALLAGSDLETFLAGGGMLVLEKAGSGEVEDSELLTLHLCAVDGELIGSETVASAPDAPWPRLLAAAAGRELAELFRDALLIALEPGAAGRYCERGGHDEFVRARRRTLRSLLNRGR